MIFDLFTATRASPGQRDRLRGGTDVASDQLTADDHADQSAQRLERELAVLLARKPKHAPKREVPLETEPDDDATWLADSSRDRLDDNVEGTGDRADDLATASHAAIATEPASGSARATLAPVGHAAAETGTRDRWLKSTRRNRRSSLFRQTASVAITLMVTVFIVSIVAMILFGMPRGFENLSVTVAKKLTTATATSNDAPSVEPVWARMKWVAE